MDQKEKKDELYSKIVDFVCDHSGIIALDKKFYIHPGKDANYKPIEVKTLAYKYDYAYEADGKRNEVLNLVALQCKWTKNTVVAWDIYDYCDECKLEELLALLSGEKIKTRRGYLILKYENGALMLPELFWDYKQAEAELATLAEGNDVHDGRTIYHLHEFEVPATAKSVSVSASIYSCIGFEGSDFNSIFVSVEETLVHDKYLDLRDELFDDYQEAMTKVESATFFNTDIAGTSLRYCGSSYGIREKSQQAVCNFAMECTLSLEDK